MVNQLQSSEVVQLVRVKANHQASHTDGSRHRTRVSRKDTIQLMFVWVHKNLGVSFNTLVKLFVCLGSTVQADLVTHHETWLGTTRYDHVTQVSVVSLDVTLPSSKVQTLFEQLDTLVMSPVHEEI